MYCRIQGQVLWTVGLFLGHWLALRFIPVPGFGAGDFSAAGNLDTYLSDWVTRILSPSFRYVFDISLLPSVANALLGVLAGQWLRSDRHPGVKTGGLVGAGMVLVVAGLLVHLDVPINKKLGSPSFHFLTCGISACLLGSFYGLIDVKGYKAWALPFVVMGMNSLTIYVAGFLVSFDRIANVFVGALDVGRAQALMVSVTAAAVKWLFLYYLYRQRIFLRI